jgi:nucleotide-binding universal stress UspA family protein
MRVLLATDGSKHASEATEWLARYPLASTTSVLVLAVAPLPVLSPGIPSTRDLEEMIVATARAAADAAATVLGRRWPEATVRVVEGDPRDRIPSVVGQWGADLLVLGARGLGAVKRVLLGSVSSAMVHHAPCPVLVVRGGGTRALGAVIVAIDGSADALAAARFFAGLRLEGPPTVQLLGVVEPPYRPRRGPRRVTGVVRAAVDRLGAERRHELEEAFAVVESALEGSAVTERIVRVGRPADEILKAARNAGLIVVGARGLGSIDRLLLGSVSEQVLYQATCPVLVVKRPR